jgi:hypothetical protein
MPLPPPKSRKHRTKAEAREASNGALVPYRYQPGQSGNAAGFPRSRREQIEACERLARERSPEAIETMTELMRNSEDDRVRLLAADKLNERGLGRSREFASNEVGASAWHDMSADELRAKLIGMVEDISKIEVPAGFVILPYKLAPKASNSTSLRFQDFRKRSVEPEFRFSPRDPVDFPPRRVRRSNVGEGMPTGSA